MASNVLSIGPEWGGGAEDDEGGLKAGVAPGNDTTEHRRIRGGVNIPQVAVLWSSVRYHAPPCFGGDSQETRPGRSLAAAGGLASRDTGP